MFEEKHKGHDLMHAEMVLIMFGSIMLTQILLFIWKQRRPRYIILSTDSNNLLTSGCVL